MRHGFYSVFLAALPLIAPSSAVWACSVEQPELAPASLPLAEREIPRAAFVLLEFNEDGVLVIERDVDGWDESL